MEIVSQSEPEIPTIFSGSQVFPLLYRVIPSHLPPPPLLFFYTRKRGHTHTYFSPLFQFLSLFSHKGSGRKVLRTLVLHELLQIRLTTDL
ncbi:hypothetical protein L6452_12865 [Arctium lappa]|uniref:Uncharacterized protein n=1 Tax=Arctium lappa TaxID=4217 RepID=A0ACB9CGZ7_ARCLA|nr:hypothetical protein L6452_12865 [Arctium lappa]